MKTSTTQSVLAVAVWLTFGFASLSPSMASECIISGETKFATIEFGGETHSYYFWAEAGQSVVIEMADLSSVPGVIEIVNGLEPRVELYGPNGCIADVGSDGKCYSRARVENCQLTMSGIYTIVVSDADGYYYSGNYFIGYLYEYTPDTGEYGLSLAVTKSTTTSLTDGDGGDMTIGHSQRGIISPGGDIDDYAFYGEVDQYVSIEMTDMSSTPGKVSTVNGLEPRIELYDPNGLRVADVGSDGKCYSRARVENYQLTMTGIYTIVVSDADGYYYSGNYFTGYLYEYTPDIGEYGLSVSMMPPEDPHGRYPYEPAPPDGSSIDLCDWNTLSWCSVDNATGYNVYFTGGPCLPLEKIAENIQVPFVPIPAVEQGQVCSWRVVAHTPDGDIQGPTWWFTTEYISCCALTISSIGQGSIVEPNEGFCEYPCGEVVLVTAVADPDYEFVRWEGTAVDANKVIIEYEDPMGSQVSVTVDGAYTLIAVFEEIVKDFSLDSYPEWIMEGQWESGEPTGQGGEEYGNPDPTSGYTGPNVFGVNLNGDYDAVLGPLYSLLAGPFDLSDYNDVNLRFTRWLNTDEPHYVTASVDVSTNDKDWRTVWESETAITDSQWVPVKYPLGDEADRQPAVYLRWTYQVVDERAYPYSGWNVDDIQLCGKRQDRSQATE